MSHPAYDGSAAHRGDGYLRPLRRRGRRLHGPNSGGLGGLGGEAKASFSLVAGERIQINVGTQGWNHTIYPDPSFNGGGGSPGGNPGGGATDVRRDFNAVQTFPLTTRVLVAGGGGGAGVGPGSIESRGGDGGGGIAGAGGYINGAPPPRWGRWHGRGRRGCRYRPGPRVVRGFRSRRQWRIQTLGRHGLRWWWWRRRLVRRWGRCRRCLGSREYRYRRRRWGE